MQLNYIKNHLNIPKQLKKTTNIKTHRLGAYYIFL